MTIREHIRTMQSRWPGLRSTSQASPVFVLAAGWRSGSTLVQRMLMHECFIWGEPFGRAMPIDALTRPLQVVTDNWPANGALLDSNEDVSRAKAKELSKEWIANLYPSMQDWLDAQVAYFTTLFQVPASRMGYSRWGLKEVRLSVDHASYLNWLFPNAKFIFLYRDPYACYRSFQALKLAFVRWPDEPIDSPERFGAHWVKLTSGFLERPADLGMLLCYEDLCMPDFDATRLTEYVGFAPNMSARDLRVGASAPARDCPDALARLQRVVEPLAGQLGYRLV